MALTVEITDFNVKSCGEQFAGKMHSISAKLIIKDGEIIIYEGVFTENHKHIYSVTDTMDKIAIKMAIVKNTIEIERVLKVEVEAEKTKMLAKITSIEEVK